MYYQVGQQDAVRRDVAEAGRPAGVPRPLALLVAGAFFMEMLDGTIVATAAPSIARSFGIRSADIGIAITAYLRLVAGPERRPGCGCPGTRASWSAAASPAEARSQLTPGCRTARGSDAGVR
jgi:hypothetical protein